MLIFTRVMGPSREIADRVRALDHGRICGQIPAQAIFRAPPTGRSRGSLQAVQEAV